MALVRCFWNDLALLFRIVTKGPKFGKFVLWFSDTCIVAATANMKSDDCFTTKRHR